MKNITFCPKFNSRFSILQQNAFCSQFRIWLFSFCQLQMPRTIIWPVQGNSRFNFWFLRHIFILYYVFLCQMLKQIFLRHMRVFLPLEISTASFKSYIGYIQRIQWSATTKWNIIAEMKIPSSNGKRRKTVSQAKPSPLAKRCVHKSSRFLH